MKAKEFEYHFKWSVTDQYIGYTSWLFNFEKLQVKCINSGCLYPLAIKKGKVIGFSDFDHENEIITKAYHEWLAEKHLLGDTVTLKSIL